MPRTACLLLFLFFSGLLTPSAQGFDFSMRTEAGFFNRAYQDRQYVTRTSITLPVPYGALGAELRLRDAEGNLLGWDLAQTTIGSGRVWNYDQWEQQPFTTLTFVSTFVGKDFGWCQLDAGVGALVQLKDFGTDPYLTASGGLGAGRPGGLSWDRQESFTLLTGLFRFLPASEPHVIVKVARGPLSLTEDLFAVQGVLPLPGSRLDAELGFSSPWGYWFQGAGILRSNERLTIGWAFGGPAGWLGLRLGVLFRPVVAGTGDADLIHRLSLGVDWSVSSQQ